MNIYDEYFEWMYQYVDGKRKRKLLDHLNRIEYIPKLPLDDNRLYDGASIRYMFGEECNIPKTVIDIKFANIKVSVLEMMLGLAYRGETYIMSDQDYGDRTVMWFWLMVKSLGLYDVADEAYNENIVDDVIEVFLSNTYSQNGEGGLYTLKETELDVRQLDIWSQMNLFFENLL